MEEKVKRTRTKKEAVPVVEEKKAPVCKGHHQLHMCFNCKDEHCKERGFFKMHRCKNSFFWMLAIASAVIATVGILAAYFIIRINDTNWTDITLPFSLLVGWFAFLVAIVAVVVLIDYKHRVGDAIYE